MSKNFYLDAEWKRWIAENVLLGGDPEGMTKILVSKGFDEEHSRLEVDAARGHPYVIASKAVVQQLRKREWVLHNSRMLREAVDCSIAEIWNSIDNASFFRNYYAINRPLIIRGGASKWPAVQLWNEEYLISKAGHREVQIQSGRNSDTRYEINASTHREVLTFADFVTRVFRSGETNDFYMTAQNSDINGRVLEPLWPDVSPIPEMLEGDAKTGRMFFWMGPSGTVTPLHHDLTNNLMIQVVGRKRVKLIAPDYLPFVYNHFHCFSEVDAEAVDLQRFPLFKKIKVQDVTIGPGDILFLPIGWWHHVRGLDPTITITCTNFRGVSNQFSDLHPKL